MPIQLRRSRSPFEIGLLLAFCVLSLLGIFFFNSAASSTMRALGPAFGRSVYVGTALAAGIGFIGVCMPSVKGLLVERVGLVSLACWLLANGITALITFGTHGIQFSGNTLAIALMCGFRAWQIGREAREVAAFRHLSAGESSKGEHG